MTDPMVSRLLGELSALRSEVAALKRAQPSGVGVSTAFGATSARPTQTGFAAELTSGYDSSTGYEWKRLDLDASVPGFVDPDVQLAGDKAFTIDDNQALAAGQLGWLDISDTAGGWVFTPVVGEYQSLEVVTNVECVAGEIVLTTAIITGYFTVEA